MEKEITKWVSLQALLDSRQELTLQILSIMSNFKDHTIACLTHFKIPAKSLSFNPVSGRRNMNALKQSKISLEIAQTLYLLMH